MIRALLVRGWLPALITIIAVVSLALYDDVPYTIAIPVLVAVLLVGLLVVIITGRRDDLERHATKIYEMTGYFTRRFMGNSNISIFATIDDLFAMENATIWEWARGCAMAQRIFDTWASSFNNRVESDFRSRRYILFLHIHINELWSINNHYYEFVEQFVEIARKYQVPANVISQYNKFSEEYNVFVQTFRETTTELRNIARIQIEAPGIKLAPELKE